MDLSFGRPMLKGIFWVPPLILIFLTTADASRHQTCPPSYPSTHGTHEVFRRLDVIWQIPPNPKSVMFLAHGNAQVPFIFFDRGPECEQCYGLPEARVVVLDALREGFAVLTLKSIGESYLNWPLENEDLDIAVDLVKTWTRQHSLEHLPLVGWGHSSGGWFVSSLAFRLPLRSLILSCSMGQPKSLNMAVPGQFPPTFFAHMNNTVEDSAMEPIKEYANLDNITNAMSILVHRGVPVFSKTTYPKRVSPALFLNRIPCMTQDTAESICRALRAGSWLDPNGYLVHKPIAEDWRAVIFKYNGLPYCEEYGDLCLAEQVQEELRLAIGIHAITSDADAEIFAWLNSPNSSVPTSLRSQSSRFGSLHPSFLHSQMDPKLRPKLYQGMS